MLVEKQNHQTVTINQAKSIISKIIAVKGKHHPVMLHSSPGIGKSSVIRQIASDLGIGVVDIRLASYEPSDLCGIPFVQNGNMEFSVPSWFPTDPESKGILFFDEISNAPISVQHAAYRIILDRSLQNNLKLPDGWVIVAAGNLKTDKTGARDIAPALANRFATHIFIRSDIDDFISYAIRRKLSTEIIGFLNFKTDALYRFDPSTNDVAFATPRSWEQASDLLAIDFDEPQTFAALCGCVGQATASEFLAFRKYYGKLPDFTKLADGELEFVVPKDDIGITFAIASSLIVALAANANNDKRIANLQKIMVQLPDDFLFLIYKSIKNSCSDRDLLNIVVVTQKTFNKITPYFTSDKCS